MSVDYGAVGVFLSGSVVGGVVALGVQLLGTRLTRQKHALKLTLINLSSGDDISKQLTLRNNGDYVEKEIELRVKILFEKPDPQTTIMAHAPTMSEMNSTMKRDDPMFSIEPEFSYKVDRLAPKEDLGLQVWANCRILNIDCSAHSEETVTRLEWQRADSQDLRNASYEHIFGPPIDHDNDL